MISVWRVLHPHPPSLRHGVCATNPLYYFLCWPRVSKIKALCDFRASNTCCSLLSQKSSPLFTWTSMNTLTTSVKLDAVLVPSLLAVPMFGVSKQFSTALVVISSGVTKVTATSRAKWGIFNGARLCQNWASGAIGLQWAGSSTTWQCLSTFSRLTIIVVIPGNYFSWRTVGLPSRSLLHTWGFFRVDHK